MSKIARKEFDDARTLQESRNDARRIRTRVKEARETRSHHVRWPFELVQNAYDVGPQDKDSVVRIDFLHQGKRLTVSHNGRPFTAKELYALLSGGSSKEFDGVETTGRFGTGFLATHALSTRVNVEGILYTVSNPEKFCIRLDRAGDENAIVKNIQDANKALDEARPLSPSEVANQPATASFTYYETNPEIVAKGLDRLECAIPYLYATCPKLGQIQIQHSGKTILSHLDADPEEALEEVEGFLLKRTRISICQDEAIRSFTVIRIGRRNSSQALLVVLEHENSQRDAILLPDEVFPKIFVKFPITGTGSLPFNVVLDGNFTPRQERDSIAMNDCDRQLIREALSALPALIRYAVESDWQGAHELARLSVPEQPLADSENSGGELEWWRENIYEVAKEIAAKPIIATESGFLPALIDDTKHAAFPVPAMDKSDQTLFDYDNIYRLATRITGLHLPAKEIAEDWGKIALKWDNLELPIERMGLTELAGWVKEKSKSVEHFPISSNFFQWLADFFLLTAELPENVNRRLLFYGLVPDQHSKLRRPQDLRIDEGIPEEIKHIAEAVGIDLWAELVHKDLMSVLDKPHYESAIDLLQEFIGQNFTETDALDQVLEKLKGKLPDSKRFVEYTDLPLLRASMRLAIHLGSEDVQRIRKCPLLTSDDSVVRLTNNQILAPVSFWPKSSKPYAELYTKNRILSDRYTDDAESDLRAALQSLIKANLVVPKPFYQGPRFSPIEGDLLKTIAPDCPVNSFNFGSLPFGQIAFLPSELVPRCGNNEKLAKRLLDFVINVSVKEDENWHEMRTVSDQIDEKWPPFQVYGSIWPFELKIRSWVPATDETGKVTGQSQANEANLSPWLVDSDWLQGNTQAIDLLHYVFGFRQLTLILQGLESDIEDDLVQLLHDPNLVKSTIANLDAVKIAVENPEAIKFISEAGAEEIQKIRTELEERKHQTEVRDRNNNFGHVIQVAVKEAMESLGLNLKLIDSGYDYKVFPDDSSFSFEIGSYFLEVKATITRDVRLTPKQAQIACNYSNRFVLCVVDLSKLPDLHSKIDWCTIDVIPYAKIVTNIGDKFKEIYKGIIGFSDTDNPIHLRNEEQLRYGVSHSLWKNGISIDSWIKSLKISH